MDMKLKPLLFLIPAACLASCSLKQVIENVFTPSSVNNYDTDPVETITNDTSSTSYDKNIEEEEVVTPENYDGENTTSITGGRNYYFQGEIAPITIKKNLEVYLFFDGVTISSDSAKAIDGKDGTKVHIVIQNGSKNTISNNCAKNALSVNGDLYLSGDGTLDIESKQQKGIKTDGDIYVSGESLTLNVAGAEHAISGRSITVSNSSVNVTSKEDGFHLKCDDNTTQFTNEQGFAYLANANITADTYGDGIQAASYVYISGGETTVTTHGEFVSYSSTNMTTYGLETDDFKFVKSGSSYKRVAKDEIRYLSSSYYALTQSVKGIKAGAIEDSSGNDITTGDYEISIAHLANVTINSSDDCIHTNYGKVTLDSCNLTLNSMDDGIHADYDLVVSNASIHITSSYEGLEGANVTINGENTNIISYSSDDGINAASDLESQTNITINDGYLRIYANGDGVDANTALYFKGGTTIVEGPGSGNGSLDSDKIYFQGGIVFACSTSGMTESMTATQCTFAYQGSTMATNKLISITDSSNNSLFSYTLKQSCNQLIFSHPNMQVGSSYNIMSDSSKITTISMTSTLTKVGISGGGPGGGGGPGWGH